MSYDQEELNREVENYCGQLRNRVVLQRRMGKSKTSHDEVWDYPCVASVCANEYYKVRNYSRPMKATSCAPSLRLILENSGEIGKPPYTSSALHQSGDKNNPLGRCAEQHAASEVLNRTDRKGKHSNILDLQFGHACQVRDIKPIKACHICKRLFPYIVQNNL